MSGKGPIAFRDYYPDLKDLEVNLDSASPSSEGRSMVYWRQNTNVSFTGVEVPSRDLPGVGLSRWSMEQLLAINETLMIGNMQQYLGLFYYRPNDPNVTSTLTFPLSRGCRMYWRGKVWMSGYSHVGLAVWDLDRPMRLDPSVPVGQRNPLVLGYFHVVSNAHYAYAIAASDELSIIYATGRRERTGFGTGIGAYSVDKAFLLQETTPVQ
jgi:hypothetical protein